MRFRRNPRPRHLPEVFCFLTIALLVPLGFIYEISIVLPAIYAPGGFLHSFTCLLATFILLNIEGNLMATMIIDTSVEIEPHDTVNLIGWKNCKFCDRLAPPRSWHCKLCGVCILKRDHHCAFTGYCVGHQNQRYFICFLFYTIIGSLYSIVYNSYYMWMLNRSFFSSFYFILPFFYRPLNLTSNSAVWLNLQILVYSLNVLLLFVSTAIFITYTPSVWHGKAFFEKKKHAEHNNGVLGNLKSVFGHRMHLAWIFPTVKSPLPEDGYNWSRIPK